MFAARIIRKTLRYELLDLTFLFSYSSKSYCPVFRIWNPRFLGTAKSGFQILDFISFLFYKLMISFSLYIYNSISFSLIPAFKIRIYFVLLIKSHLQSYPCPLQINSFWNLGFLLGITIILQIITGIFLGLHYTSDLNSAYSSLFFFIREIYYGCLLYTSPSPRDRQKSRMPSSA